MLKRRTLILLCSAWSFFVPWPADAQNAAASADGLVKISDTEFELRGIRIFSDRRELHLRCRVNMTDGIIEYALVHHTGKTHESILSTTVSPSDLQVALLLCHYEPATVGILPSDVPFEQHRLKITEPKTPNAHHVAATVEWTSDGKKHRAALATWIQNKRTEQAPTDLPFWIFNGSIIDQRGFVAEADGSILSVWFDPEAMLNSPAQGNLDDERWLCMTSAIPPEGTVVTLILHPPSP